MILRNLSFDHKCLRNIAGIYWPQKVRNAEVRKMIFGKRAENRSLEKIVNHNRLRWLGHVLRMENHRFPFCSLYLNSVGEARRSLGQCTTWKSNMKSLTIGLSRVGPCRLPGWGPRDSSNQWLDTLSGMARNRSQWRSCIFALSDE